MKRIKSASVDKKDRVVCVTVTGAHIFYYQPCGSDKRFYLFTTEDFSGSVFVYFRDHGRCADGRGFSLTIQELYEDRRMYRNPKIGKLFDRLPGLIDCVLRENTERKEPDNRKHRAKKAVGGNYDDRDLAA